MLQRGCSRLSLKGVLQKTEIVQSFHHKRYYLGALVKAWPGHQVVMNDDFSALRDIALYNLPHTHTHTLCGFTVLLDGTSTCGQQEPGIEPATLWLVDDRLDLPSKIALLEPFWTPLGHKKYTYNRYQTFLICSLNQLCTLLDQFITQSPIRPWPCSEGPVEVSRPGGWVRAAFSYRASVCRECRGWANHR